MNRFAVIDRVTGVVKNVVILSTNKWIPPSGCFVINSPHADVGDTYDQKNTIFIKKQG